MAITDPTAPQPNSAMPAQTQPLLQPAVAQTTTAERGPSLSEPRWSDWSIDGHIDEDLGEYLEKNLSPPFQAILEEFLISADTCVQRFDSLRQRHERWRRGIIVGTGLVAIINALSALVAGLPHRDDTLPLLAVTVAGLAAVAAAVLAILANLENSATFWSARKRTVKLASCISMHIGNSIACGGSM